MNIQVIGVAFSDLKGFPFGVYDPLGTNKGNVIVTQGGVARNVAADLNNLGAGVKFALMLDEGEVETIAHYTADFFPCAGYATKERERRVQGFPEFWCFLFDAYS